MRESWGRRFFFFFSFPFYDAMYCLIIFYTCYGAHIVSGLHFFLRGSASTTMYSSLLLFSLSYLLFLSAATWEGDLSSRFYFFVLIPHLSAHGQYSSTVGGLPFVFILKGVDGRNKVMVDYSVLLLLFSPHPLFAKMSGILERLG